MNKYDVSRILLGHSHGSWVRYPDFVIWFNLESNNYSWANTKIQNHGFDSFDAAFESAIKTVQKVKNENL